MINFRTIDSKTERGEFISETVGVSPVDSLIDGFFGLDKGIQDDFYIFRLRL